MDDLINELRRVVGSGHVLVDADLRAGHEIDWTGRYGGKAAAVIRPADTREVSEVVLVCAERDATIITQGGNTGLVGASVPRADLPRQVVLSTGRLDTVGPADVASMQITLGAGVTIATWRDVARRAGCDAPIDFAARDSATIGGAIATNAGGSRVVRFSTMRGQVVGVEAVLADGSVVGSLSGIVKETAGVHWPSLFAGAEGTLGVVTRARVKLVPRYAHRCTAMVGLESIDAALGLLARFRSDVESLDSIEVLEPDAVRLAAEHLGMAVPVEVAAGGAVVIVECAAHQDPTDDLAAALAGAAGVTGTAVSNEPGGAASLVAFRDRMTEAIAASSTRIGVPTFKLDVAVPVDRIEHLLNVARTAADVDGCRLIAFGHLAEGNLHLNHLGARDTDRIADTVLAAVAELDGTISAEHGIGIAKAHWLPLIRTTADLAAQRALRSALDPLRLFNPGVLDPDG